MPRPPYYRTLIDTEVLRQPPAASATAFRLQEKRLAHALVREKKTVAILDCFRREILQDLACTIREGVSGGTDVLSSWNAGSAAYLSSSTHEEGLGGSGNAHAPRHGHGRAAQSSTGVLVGTLLFSSAALVLAAERVLEQDHGREEQREENFVQREQIF